MEVLFERFIADVHRAEIIEWIAVVAGILSVWYSKKENILVYPVGLINTIIYVYLSLKAHLAGEAAVNVYYTIVSIYGWILWNKKSANSLKPALKVSYLNKKESIRILIFFGTLYSVIFLCLTYIKKAFWPGAIPWADALASASAFTAMWLMARKKVESWIGWIITNIVSVPLYFVKGLSLTSVYYTILLFLAVAGFLEWNRKAKIHNNDV